MLARQNQIGNAEQPEKLHRVFRLPAETRLPVTQQVFADMEMVLDLGAHTRPEHFHFFTHASQFRARQCLVLGTFYCYVPMHRFALILFTLFYALIASIGQHDGFITVQQGMCLRDISDVASRADKRMDQTG